jgi:predicted Zn-dependent protease
MVTFFQKLDAMREREPNVIEAWFSTHPSPEERVENVADFIASLPPREGPVTETGKLEQIQARLK